VHHSEIWAALQIEPYSKTPSGDAPFVPVMQTADFSNRNNPANRLHRTRIWRIFIQGQMKTASVIQIDDQKPISVKRERYSIGGIHGAIVPCLLMEE
jgi:hypothetical protein